MFSQNTRQFLSTYDILHIISKRQNENHVETRPCEENTRLCFGIFQKPSVEKIKARKKQKAAKKVKAKKLSNPEEDFCQANFESLYPS